jgi:hypothetical protein
MVRDRGKDFDLIHRDDEWSAALSGLNGISRPRDLKPLADLMKRGSSVPGDVAQEIGMLLDPPWGDKGPRLRLDVPKRWDTGAAIQEIGRKRKLRARMLRVYKRTGNKKRVIASFAVKLRLTEAYLRKCWQLTDKETVLQCELIRTEGVSDRTTRKPKLA